METTATESVGHEQILSVRNLERFNNAMDDEDVKTLRLIIKEMQANLSDKKDCQELSEKIIEFEKLLCETKVNKQLLADKLSVNSKIIIPKRIIRTTDDSESDSDSSTMPDSTSEDTGRKSATPTTSEATTSGGEEESSDITHPTNRRTGIDDTKDNEIIRNTMSELNCKKTLSAYSGPNKPSKRVKSIVTPNLDSASIEANQDELENKSVSVSFDIDAARILNADPWNPVLVDKDNANGASDGDQVNKGSVNSTNIQDDTGKYFTVLHDIPREGPCKKCPQMKLINLNQWWKVQQKYVYTF